MPAARNNPKAFADWYEQDYFRRPRRPWVLTAAVAAAVLVCGAAVAVTFTLPRGRLAYQAGPLSAPHAFLADNCAACHTEAFATAVRLSPAHAADRATPDRACLGCHAAGAHNPHQTQFTGAAGQSADCAACHREHRGGASVARLDDTYCVSCHRNLPTDDGQHRFAAGIRHFDADHPPFGAWRGGPLADPGTLKFNHKAHLALADALKDVPAERLGPMQDALTRLRDLSCTACHEPDNDRLYVRAVRYDRHCGACHPITVPAVGDVPAGRVRHPAPGETAATVRGELLDRFWKQIAAAAPPPPPATDDVRPPVLDRSLPPLTPEQRAKVADLTKQAEGRVFDPAGGDVLTVLEQPLFRTKGGCAYCHEVSTGPGKDGLPNYQPPRLRDRWASTEFPHPKFGSKEPGGRTLAEQAARDRWFPYAKFSHEAHRMLDCQGCHAGAAASTTTGDVLMPQIGVCQQCHNHSTAGVRSDCLECHTYHDRGMEPRGLHGRLTVEEALGKGR